MAKRRGAKTGKPGKGQKSQKLKIQRVVHAGLDAMGKAYARLLLDPCGAPLAHPVWGSQEGSLLVKTEIVLNVAVDGTNLNGALLWSPGTITPTARANLVEVETLAANTAVDTSTASGTGYVVTDLGVNSPGQVFLTTQASVYRPVAACMEVMYLGSESSRSGSIGGGVVSGGTWYNTAGFTVDRLASLVPHGERTPVNKTEFLWYPSGADELFQDPVETVAAQQVDRRNSIAFNWTGIAATSGFRVKLTAVYEYKPKLATGIAMPPPDAGSRNSMRDVLGTIARTVAGNPYVRSAAMAAGHQFVRAVQYQYNQAPRIRGVSYRASIGEL
jgi:hypothetical protein